MNGMPTTSLSILQRFRSAPLLEFPQLMLRHFEIDNVTCRNKSDAYPKRDQSLRIVPFNCIEPL